MLLLLQLTICFVVPLIIIFLYIRFFSKLTNTTVFNIGLFNTITFSLLFSTFSSLYFWGLSGLIILSFLYLIFIVPILSIGFLYWIWIYKNELEDYKYALFTSISYLSLIFLFFTEIFNQSGK